MKISKKAHSDAKRLFLACQANGRLVEDRVREVVNRLATEKPRGYLPALVEFGRLVRLEIARRSAKVETAVPLTETLKDKVASALAKLHGEGLETSFVEEPALIGGMRIQVGSNVYDGSVQSRLNELKETF